MGIGQSYESYEKELLDREVTKGFEELEEASIKLNDAINNLWGKKGVKALEKLDEAQRLIDEVERANDYGQEDGCYDEAERVGMYKTPFGWM